MLLDTLTARNIVDVLTADQFYRLAHKYIFQAAAAVIEDGMAVDFVTICNELERSGRIKDATRVDVSTMMDGVPHRSNWIHYANIVREMARRRDILHAATRLRDEVHGGVSGSQELLDLGDRWLQEIRTGTSSEDLVGPEQAVPAFLDSLDFRIQHRHELIGVSTGFPSLDDVTCGLIGGELVIVAADTGGGKSCFAGQVALAVAKSVGGVWFASLEMSRQELYYRMASAETGIMLYKLRTGILSSDEREHVTLTMARHAAWPLWIGETTSVTVAQLRATCRRVVAELAIRQLPLSLVVVDYIQLMTAESERWEENRAAQLATISRGLKLLARELAVPVIALSQLSRGSRKEKRRPELSDLRDSGALEQDADAVWFLYDKPEMSDDGADTELIIRKQRNGPAPHTVALAFQRSCVRFRDVEADKKTAPTQPQPLQAGLPVSS